MRDGLIHRTATQVVGLLRAGEVAPTAVLEQQLDVSGRVPIDPRPGDR